MIIGAAAIALAWFGVARGMRPLEHMRAELLGRSPRDLRPITNVTVPTEIAPVTEAFNALLRDLRDASTLQQLEVHLQPRERRSQLMRRVGEEALL